MSNNNWSEQKIDELLNQAPKLQDTRSKEEVLKRLKEDPRLNDDIPKKRKTWVPSLVGVAAILTLSLLTTTLLNQPSEEKSEMAQDQSYEKSSNKESSDDSTITMMETEVSEEEPVSTEEETLRNEKSITALTVPENQGSNVYPSEISEDVTVFRMGLAGDAANSVPITFLIPISQIEADFGNEKPSQLDLYHEYAPRIDEEALGFLDYHPYKGEFLTEGDSLIHILPKDHNYDLASGTITVYFQTLKETFQEYSRVEFLNEDGTTLEFDQAGEPSKPMELNGGVNHYSYYRFQQSNGNDYLTPNFGQISGTLTEALLQMKEKPNEVYDTLIPEEVYFEVQEENDTTRVIFSEPLDLEQMDDNSAMYMIESMLLTGASFGSSIQFENVVQPTWNGFDFTHPLPIPLGANETQFLLK